MILVTGGAGFIGSHLVRAFLERGEKVRVLDDFSSGKHANLAEVADDVELFEGSVTDAALVARAVAGARVVVHQAACPSVVLSQEQPQVVHEANATGTLVVLDQAQRAGCERLLFAGSSAVYGVPGDAPATEQDPVQPLSAYGAQKLLGENYCKIWSQVQGLPTVTLRYFNVFGPRQDPGSPYSGVISIFCSRAQAGESVTIHGDGLQTRDFTFVKNVVDANLAAAEAEIEGGEVFNIATGRSITLLELWDAVCQLEGIQREPSFGPARRGDVRHSRANIEAARGGLGFEPQGEFLDGLKQTLDWYRTQAGTESGVVR